MISILQIATLMLGTFASEDLTCIAAGQLVAQNQISIGVAISGCMAGIYIGDLALFMIGRCVGSPARHWLAKRSPAFRMDRLEKWFDENAVAAIFASRFIPGARLPMYLAAGALGRKGVRFALITFLAAALWTPLLVLGVASIGDRFIAPLRSWLGGGWIAVVIGIGLIAVLIHLLRRCVTSQGRAQLIANISKIWRWEFWPMWLFYPPVIAWIAWLAIRHRSLAVVSAANPGIPHGGLAGESKYDILCSSNSPFVLPTSLIAESTVPARIEHFENLLAGNRWQLPVILKPDAGERGTAVKLIRTMPDALAYFQQYNHPAIVQPFHPGPFEAGIFYYRYPSEKHGRIFSITDKHFPILMGDGQHTIEQLIWQHPRYRMQAKVFLERHAVNAARVLAKGESFTLAMAGNHCQGTMFKDGAQLITPALEARVDEIAKSFPGFFIGRFDVRYANVEAFRAGEEFSVMELNGITSESTNIYDPSWSLLRAYRTLFRQWRIIFEIGAQNRRAGERTSTLTQAWRAVSLHSSGMPRSSLSD